MNHIEELLKRTFISNHEIQNGNNPNSIYLPIFSDEHIEKYSEEVEVSLNNLKRKYLKIDARKKPIRKICEEITGSRPKTLYKGLNEIFDSQLKNDFVLVFIGLSKCSSRINKEDLFRGLIKNLDDAHFKGVHPKSDLLFIDSAGFLESNWDYLGSYLTLNFWPNSLTESEHFSSMLYLNTNKN